MKKYFLSILITIFILTGCTANVSNAPKVASAPKAEENKKVSEIRVYNWGDYLDPEVLEKFTAKTGIKVNYEEYSTNEDMYVKLKNGANNYDVVMPSGHMLMKMINEGMIDKLDMTKIKNFKHVGDEFKSLQYDAKNEYGIAYYWGVMGILYNSKEIKEPVNSWNILFDKKYSGKILMLDSQRDALMIPLKLLDFSMNTTNPTEIERAKELLIKQKPLVLAYGVDNVKHDMASGAGWLFPTWNGDAVALKAENADLKFALPKEGTNIGFDFWVVPKNAKNKDAAHEFINFMLDPEISAQNARYVGYSITNKAGIELLDENIKNNKTSYPVISEIKSWEVYVDLGEDIALYNKAWTDIKATK